MSPFVKEFEGQKINISIHNANPEVLTFGNGLSAAFGAAGFQTNTGPVTFIGAALPRGVTIRFGPNRQGIANAVAKCLVDSNVVGAVYPAKGISDDDFLIIVAP